jgi:hypothetical protein
MKDAERDRGRARHAVAEVLAKEATALPSIIPVSPSNDQAMSASLCAADRRGSVDKKRLRALWVDCLGLAVEGNYRSERGKRRRDYRVPEAVDALRSGPHAADRSGEKPAVQTGAQSRGSLGGRPARRRRMADRTRGAFAPAESARARQVTTSRSSIRRATKPRRSAAKGVLIELVQAPTDYHAAAGQTGAISVLSDSYRRTFLQ